MYTRSVGYKESEIQGIFISKRYTERVLQNSPNLYFSLLHFSVFQVTLADLKTVGFFEWQSDINWSKYPKLEALVDRVKGIPELAKWLKERPVTEF